MFMCVCVRAYAFVCHRWCVVGFIGVAGGWQAVFHPRAAHDENVLKQEGWHYELDNPEDPLECVVSWCTPAIACLFTSCTHAQPTGRCGVVVRGRQCFLSVPELCHANNNNIVCVSVWLDGRLIGGAIAGWLLVERRHTVSVHTHTYVLCIWWLVIHRFKGVVYNEMKGVYSNPESLLGRRAQQLLFPDVSAYRVDSGGDPREIPELT